MPACRCTTGTFRQNATCAVIAAVVPPPETSTAAGCRSRTRSSSLVSRAAASAAVVSSGSSGQQRDVGLDAQVLEGVQHHDRISAGGDRRGVHASGRGDGAGDRRQPGHLGAAAGDKKHLVLGSRSYRHVGKRAHLVPSGRGLAIQMGEVCTSSAGCVNLSSFWGLSVVRMADSRSQGVTV